MALRRLGTVVAAALCLAVLSTGNARALNFINLTPSAASDSVGEAINVLLSMDFTEPTTGGGLLISYDSLILDFVSFEFDPGLDIPDAAFQKNGPAAGSAANPLEVGFGWLMFTPPYGGEGYKPIGTLIFNGLSPGTATIATQSTLVGTPNGPFSSIGGQLDVYFQSVSVTVTGVPEPGAGLLVALGLVGLGVRGHRRNTRSC